MSMAKLWLRVHEEKKIHSIVVPRSSVISAAASSNQPFTMPELQPRFYFNKVFRFHRQLEDGPLAQLEVEPVG